MLSYLSQLSEALPNAYNQSDPESKGCSKKVVLRLADRTKEHFEELVISKVVHASTLTYPSLRQYSPASADVSKANKRT